MHDAHKPLALSAALTSKTNQLCLGLESGGADILELVTPTTAELLMWWFGEDMVTARSGLNFHAGQKQAILNAIVAHEVLGHDQGRWTLLDLYRAVATDALLTGTRMAEVSDAKHAHPKYCFKMATGIYLVETKAQQQAIHPKVQRKLKAAVAWCDRINGLPAEYRGGRPWHYVLLAENVVHEWQAKGAHLAELLDYARLRPLAAASLQQRLL